MGLDNSWAKRQFNVSEEFKREVDACLRYGSRTKLTQGVRSLVDSMGPPMGSPLEAPEVLQLRDRLKSVANKLQCRRARIDAQEQLKKWDHRLPLQNVQRIRNIAARSNYYVPQQQLTKEQETALRSLASGMLQPKVGKTLWDF